MGFFHRHLKVKARRNINRIGILCNGRIQEVNKQELIEVHCDLELAKDDQPSIGGRRLTVQPGWPSSHWWLPAVLWWLPAASPSAAIHQPSNSGPSHLSFSDCRPVVRPQPPVREPPIHWRPLADRLLVAGPYANTVHRRWNKFRALTGGGRQPCDHAC